MKLLIVITNYRVAHLTIECLRSIAGQIEDVPGSYVGVCENGTSDDSAERIQNAITANGWEKWCNLTTVRINLGFTGGNNVILEHYLRSANRPEYVLLLNADTLVLPNAFRALVDFMDQHSAVGIAGSRLENPDGTAQRSAFRFHSPMSELEGAIRLGLITRLFRKWVVAPPVSDAACESEWVSGASMIIRAKVLQDIGLLDDGFFTYYEDTDFCFNARKAGWKIWYVPTSRVMHLGGQSTGISINSLNRQPSYSFQARRRYFLKNHGALYAAMADIALIVGISVWRVREFFGKPDRMPPHFLRDTIRHSVFLTGFKLQVVKNPAFETASEPQTLAARRSDYSK